MLFSPVVADKAELAALQTADYLAQKDQLIAQSKRLEQLLPLLDRYQKTLRKLQTSLSTSGLAELRGDVFHQWLFDFGLGKLQTALRDHDGNDCEGSVLLHNNVTSMMMQDKLSFNDAAHLLLYGFIAHRSANPYETVFALQRSVLFWNVGPIADWIESLEHPYECLKDAGWTGAALCSLSPMMVVNASKGEMKTQQANKFIRMVGDMRRREDGEMEPWVIHWTGSSIIDNQTM